MIIANTLFQKPTPPPPPPPSTTKKQTKKQKQKTNKQTNNEKSRYWTWESLDGETRNQTDFTLSSQKGIEINCEVITKVDIGSDHRFVRMTLRINKRLARLKTKKKQNLLMLTHKNSEA